MSTGAFPKEPWKRKAILVLDQHDIERCGYELSAAGPLLDEETFVLKFPPESTNSVVAELLDAGQVRPGVVLVQSPFDKDVYEDVTQAASRFALAKHTIFSTFCMHLGAREVVVEQIELQSRTGRTTVDVKAGRAGVQGKVKAEHEAVDSFRSQMTLHDVFSGGEANPAEAEALLRRTGLLGDPNMRSLLEIRSAITNVITERRLTLNLSSEAKRNLNVVGRLNVASFVKLEADYARAVREQSEYHLTVRVTF